MDRAGGSQSSVPFTSASSNYKGLRLDAQEELRDIRKKGLDIVNSSIQIYKRSEVA